MVVDEFVGGGVERDEGGHDEAGRRIRVAVRTWRRDESEQDGWLWRVKVKRVCVCEM